MSQFEYYEKRWGKIKEEKTPQPESNKNSSLSAIVLSPLLVVRFVLQLFVTGPDRQSQNPIQVILMGLFLFVFNLYLIFNIDLVDGFFGTFLTEGSGIHTGVTGLAALFVIFQCLRAIFIIGGWNQVYVSKYSRPFKGGYQYIASNDNSNQSNGSGSGSDDNFSKVNNLMNQHMEQLTNSQKINYLKDFYGGKD